MSDPEIHADPSALVASILDEQTRLTIRHIPIGATPGVEVVPTVQVRGLMVPPMRYNRVAGVHVVTVRLMSVNPEGHGNLLEQLPAAVNRGCPIIGSDGSILHIDRSPVSRAMGSGGMTHSTKARVTLAERRPALVGTPYEWRFANEVTRLGNVVGATVTGVLHGAEVFEDGLMTSTLTGKVPAGKGVARALKRQVGRHADGIGTLSSVEVSSPDEAGEVSLVVTYEARVSL